MKDRMNYEGFHISSIVKKLEDLVKLSSEIEGNPTPQKKSGYFTLMDRSSGRILFVWCIGEPPLDRAEKYCRLSQEKARRLFGNLKHKHVSSYQSRDGIDKFGGAIVAGSFIMSFSGCAELIDEAIVLCLALHFLWSEAGVNSSIIKVSKNPFFESLFRKLQQLN